MTTPEITFQDPRSRYRRILDRGLQSPDQLDPRPADQGPRDNWSSYHRMLGRVREGVKREDAAIVQALSTAARYDPDLAADVQQLGLNLGMPDEMVEADIDRAREVWRIRQLNAIQNSGGSPLAIRAMLDPRFARIAHDDIKNLSYLEKLSRQWNAGWLESRQALLWDRVRSGDATEEERAEIEEIADQLVHLPASSRGSDFWESITQGAVRTVAGMADVVVESFQTGAALAGTAAVAGQLGPQVALPEEVVSVPAMFTAGFLGQLAGSSGQREGGAAYGQMIEMGIDPHTAEFYSLGIGVVNGLLETVSAGVLTAPFRQAASRALSRRVAQEMLSKPLRTGAAWQFAQDYAKGLGAEVATELAQEVSSYVGEELAIAEQRGVAPGDLEGLEGRAGLMDRLAEITAETIRGMALLALPGPTLQLSHNLRRAREAERGQEWMEQLSQGTRDSRVRPRNQRLFRRFLEQASEGTPVEKLYVSLEDFRRAMHERGLTESQLRELSPEGYRALEEAKQTGTVEIRTADYMAALGEFGTHLIPDVRVDPGGVSGREAQAMLPALEADLDVALEEDQSDPSALEADAIETATAQQLESAGQRPEVAATAARYYRSLVVQKAEEEGVSPAEWQRRSGLEFLSEQDFERSELAESESLDQPDRPDGEQPEGDQPDLPVDPIDPVDPTVPVDRVDPIDPVDPTVPVDRVDPPDPAALPVEDPVSPPSEPVGSPTAREPAPSGLSATDAFGRFLPDLRLALLSEKANPSTVFHEMSHFYLFAIIDMVRRGVASERTRADLDTLLDWFGIKGETAEARFQTWESLSFDKQRKFHEQLAFNFEDYLFDGQAPSVGLQRVFAKIRSWMLALYRDIRGHIARPREALNKRYTALFGRQLPGLTLEVRQVFDRMVASEDAIQAAESARSMLPLFQTKEEFLAVQGRTEADWDRYQQALEDAHQDAVTDLSTASVRQLQWLRDARSRALRDLQRKHDQTRKEVKQQVRQELENEDIYLAESILRRAKAAEKMRLEQVEELLSRMPEQEAAAARERLGIGLRGRQTMVSPQGADLGFLASAFGHESGQALLRAFLASRPLDVELEARTDQRMVQDHSELQDERQVQEAVDRALHRQARARFVAAELKFLSGSVQPARVMLASLKQAAARLLGARKIRDIQPSRFSQAEARAAREAERAIRPGRGNQPGDPDAAVRAKRQQLLYGEMTRGAYRVRDEVQRILRAFRTFGRPLDRLAKSGDVGILQAAQWILAQYGLASLPQAQRATDYLELVRRYDPSLYELVEPEMAKAQARGSEIRGQWRDLTMDELRAIHQTVETLRFRAKRDLQVEVEGKKVAIKDAVEELVEQLGEVPAEVGGERGALSDAKKMQLRLGSTKANLTKAEHFLRMLDGGKVGPFLRYIFNGVRHALDSYRADASRYIKQLTEDIAGMRKRGLIRDGSIESSELNYVFGDGKRTGMVELLGAMLHMGNESNRTKFLVAGRGEGFSWADWNPDGSLNTTRWDTFIQRLVSQGVLTKEHFDFLQRVWDINEQILPQIQEAHKDIHGRFFKVVPAQEFTIHFPNGEAATYRGGYVPATRDPDLVPVDRLDVRLEEIDAEFQRGLPKSSDGFTKERAENYVRRPLSMDLNTITAHIDEAVRYSHVQPRVNDVLRLLRRGEFATPLRRLHRDAIDSIIVPYLQRAVRQSMYERGRDPLQDSFWRFVRINTGVGIMFGNVVNALQQFTGISNAHLFVKHRNLRHALYQWLRRRDLGKKISEMSEFMDDRLQNQMLGLTTEMRELLMDTRPMARLQNWVGRKAYFLQSGTQGMVDTIVWWGKYQESLGANLTHEQAVSEADSAVRLSQGSFNPEDTAPYEVGTPFHRTWTQFTSYFNTVANQVGYATDSRTKAALLAFSMPMIFAQAIAMTLWQQWDDEDDDGHMDPFLNLIAYSQVSGAFSMVPGYGPAALGVFDQIFTDRAYGTRVAASPAMVTLTRSLTGVISAAQAITSDEKDLTGRNVRDTLTAISLLVPGAGAGAWAIRPASYLTDVAQDRVEPQGPVDVTFGILSGRASQASRQ